MPHEADQSTQFTYPATVSVLIGQGERRHAVDARLIAVNSKTVYVRLPSGKIVRRKVLRDVPGWRPGDGNELAYPVWSTTNDEPSPSTWEHRGFDGEAA